MRVGELALYTHVLCLQLLQTLASVRWAVCQGWLSERQKRRLGGRSDLVRQCQVAAGCEVAELYRMQVAALGTGPRPMSWRHCRKDGQSARSCEATRYTMRHSLASLFGGESAILARRRLEACGQGRRLMTMLLLGVLPCLFSWEAASWREAGAGPPTAKATKMPS